MSDLQIIYRRTINKYKLQINSNIEEYEKLYLEKKLQLDRFLLVNDPRGKPDLFRSLMDKMDELTTEIRINREINNHLIRSLDDYHKDNCIIKITGDCVLPE